MKDALKTSLLAFALGLIATAGVFQVINSYRMRDAESAALAAGLPFFGVAVLALLLAMMRRNRPDARIINSGVSALVGLLVLSGVWVFVVLMVWGH